MATTFMNLDLPVVGITIGPLWANDINAALTLVDSHDHSTSNGQKVTQAGINITADFDVNAETITNIGSCKYSNLAATLASTNAIYVKDGDLYFNDSSATAIQVTASGTLNISATGGIAGDYTTTAASVVYTDALLTYFFLDSAGARAFVDASVLRSYTTYSTGQVLDSTVDEIVLASGNTTLVLPAAGVSSGKFFKIKKTDSVGTIVTIDGNASETIDGELTQTITQQYEALEIICNGTGWYIL